MEVEEKCLALTTVSIQGTQLLTFKHFGTTLSVLSLAVMKAGIRTSYAHEEGFDGYRWREIIGEGKQWKSFGINWSIESVNGL